MPLDARFLHWLQATDDELLYRPGELCVDTALEVSGPNRTTTSFTWEARAWALTRENAALREDDA